MRWFLLTHWIILHRSGGPQWSGCCLFILCFLNIDTHQKIVPRSEVDTTMVRDPSKLKANEVVVRYFEDNTLYFFNLCD